MAASPETPSGLGPSEIDPAEITLVSAIADGAFGTVYKGVCRHKDVAVKVLFRQFDEDTLSAFRKEVEIMSKISHPNVTLFRATQLFISYFYSYYFNSNSVSWARARRRQES